MRILKQLTATLALAAALLVPALSEARASRIKDIARVSGARANQIYGMGLVSGLQGTGDNVRNSPYSAEFVANLMQEFDVQIDPENMRQLENFAVVMVTAELPPFANPGDKLDATVSAVGSAESLKGGILLQTALKGADDKVYGVAQGPVSLGSTIGQGGQQARRAEPHETTGRIPNGVLVENSVPVTMLEGGDRRGSSPASRSGGSSGENSLFDRVANVDPPARQHITIKLDNPDFTTAASLSRAVNDHFREPLAQAVDGGTIEVKVPNERRNSLVSFISEVEQIQVDSSSKAKVVINQRTGTVVVGGNVEIQPVSIAQSGISLSIGEDRGQQDQGDGQQNQQDGQQGGDQQLNLNAQDQEGEETEQKYLNRVSTADVVSALNRLGVTPKELVAIFEALDASGALLADLKVI